MLEAKGISGKLHGNAVNMTRSGNPGYIAGLPVLSATDDKMSDTMRARVPGLGVMGSATDGSCPAPQQRPFGTRNVSFGEQTVNFGEDMMTGCVLKLTKPEFAELCDGSDTSK